MTLFDAFGFEGKRAVVVGGATGMGAAAADVLVSAGAEVINMDYAPVTTEGAKAVQVNLADKASIDAALGEIGGPIDALLSCAGVADGTPGIEKINYVGHRYLVDQLLEQDQLRRGSAIGFISSAAGLGWEANLAELKQLIAISDFDDAAAWMQDRGKADYLNTKQAICAYVATQAFPMLKRGIRINAICPGPTDTPLAQANAEMWLGFGADYRKDVGVEASSPLEQAYTLVYLCSEAARAISGITLITDMGYFAAGMTEEYPSATPIVNFLMGRM